MKSKIPSKEIFETFFFEHSNTETAAHFNVGLTTIFKWARKLDVARKCSRYKDIQVPFTTIQKEILEGSLLGDGSLGKLECNCNHSYFRELHGPKQENYLRWKCDMLKPFSVEVVKCKNNKTYDAFRFHTIRHQLFTDMEKQWYKRKDNEYVLQKGKRIKCIPDSIDLTPLVISVWFFDDGWRPKKDNQIYLSTHGFDYSDVEKLIIQLNNKYNLGCKIRLRTKNKLPEIAIPATGKECFLNLVKPNLPCSELLYKIN